MAETERDFRVPIGNSWSARFTVVDDDDDPVNLTGATTRCLLKSDPDSADSVATATIAVSYVNASVGQVRISLTYTQTAALSEGQYWFDFLVRTSEGKEGTPLGGAIYAYTPITRALT